MFLVTLLPILNPDHDPLHITLNIVRIVTLQLYHNLIIVGFPSLFQKHFHNLGIKVLLQLALGIISGLQPVV